MSTPNGENNKPATKTDAPPEEAAPVASQEDLEARKAAEEQAAKDAEDRRNGVLGREANPELGGESFQYGQQPE